MHGNDTLLCQTCGSHLSGMGDNYCSGAPGHLGIHNNEGADTKLNRVLRPTNRACPLPWTEPGIWLINTTWRTLEVMSTRGKWESLAISGPIPMGLESDRTPPLAVTIYWSKKKKKISKVFFCHCALYFL